MIDELFIVSIEIFENVVSAAFPIVSSLRTVSLAYVSLGIEKIETSYRQISQ
jgi:hypothetical protein